MFNDLLHFMHITKTGGGSLIYILNNIDELKNKLIYTNNPYLLDVNEYRNKKIVFGHFTYGIHQHTQQPPNYGAMFRHPLTRVISHYYHLCNFEDSIIGEKIRQQGKDINDYFQNAKNLHGEFQNFYLQNLSTHIMPNNKFLSLPLDAAMDRIRQMRFIGIQEFYELSLIRLADILNISYNKFLEPHNIRINATHWNLNQIEPKTINIIAKYNQVDIKLYSLALNLFNKQIIKELYI